MQNDTQASAQAIEVTINDEALATLAWRLSKVLTDVLSGPLADRVLEKLAARQAEADEAQKALAAEFKQVLAQVYERYPFLNDEGQEPNQPAIKETLDRTNSLISTGIPNAAAVMQAAIEIGPKYDTRPTH